MIHFKTINLITSVIALILFLILMLGPEVIFFLFGISSDDSALFMSRRSAVLFLALAVLAWFIRNNEDLETQQAVCLSFVTMMAGLAALGIIEYGRGYAEMGIVIAVLTETILGVVYFKIYARNRAQM